MSQMMELSSYLKDPLSVVEERLDAVQTWPTYILVDMFVEDPNEVSVREVSGFMYGNGVPFNEAERCLQVCNGGRREFIKERMWYWYKLWDSSVYAEKYYSVVLKMAWIHGKTGGGTEACQSALQVRHFGPEPSGCGTLIWYAINKIKRERDVLKNEGV